MVFGKWGWRRTVQESRMGPCASKSVYTVDDEAMGSTRPKTAPQERKPTAAAKGKKKGLRSRVSGAAVRSMGGGGNSPTLGRKAGALRGGNAPSGHDRNAATAPTTGKAATDKNGAAAGWVDDPAWAALLQTHQSRIVDPADVRIVMEEEAAHRIDQLSPAQVVLLQRHVRKIVQDLLATAPPPATTTSAMMNSVMGRIGQGSNSSNYSSNSHSNGNSHSAGAGGGGGSNGNSNITNDDAKSRAVFSKEHLLDEGLFRKIFEGGERLLQMGWDDAWHEGSRAEFLDRQKQKADKNGHAGPKDEQANQPQSPSEMAAQVGTMERQHSAKQVETNGGGTEDNSMPSRGTNGNRHHAAAKASRRRRGSGKGAPDSDPGHIAASPNYPGGVDVFGAAYLLLLHAAEERWDYVAEVAELSAECAGLTLDVNEVAKQADEEEAAALAKREEDEEEPPSLSPKKVRVPPPPNRRGSYDQLGSQPPLPSGVSFSSITFLLAVALYGTREEKLNLLFYLLLPPKRLKSLLDDHPAGGVPTWLLESGTDTIISYASLSHWYYFCGTVPPDGKPPVGKGQDAVKGSESLTVNSSAAVEMMAILLQGALEVDDEEDDDDTKTTATVLSTSEMTATTTATRKSSGEVERRATDGVVHELLSEALNETRSAPSDAPSCYITDRAARENLLDQFWSASSAMPSNGSAAAMAVWTEVEFFQWAEKALQDGALDLILWRLFGTGLLTSPAMERDLVLKCWMQWEKLDLPRWLHQDGHGGDGILAQSMQKLFHFSGDGSKSSSSSWPYAIYGGLGGADGLGGLGHGVLYCIDKSWWTQWEEYCSWKWNSEEGKENEHHGVTVTRPPELSPERLLDRSPTSGAIPGTLGSVETMKAGLEEGVDYVTVPPPVWDVLYELYGGGQPLPRMTGALAGATTNGGPAPAPAVAATATTTSAAGVEVVATATQRPRPSRIPRELVVLANPWVVHCQACDPFQPYRRGDVGTLSIRVMSAPSQPLWRLFAEIVIRLPAHHPRARDPDGVGRARLWRRLDPTASKEAQPGVTRYGPWALLCKSRNASIPVGEGISYSSDGYKNFIDGWKQYGDGLTVEKAGLADGGRLMFEFAVLSSKDGALSWPREAAAKAGRARRLQEEDLAFRRLLRGLDADGKLKKGGIVDTDVDALDASGRWYRGVIVQVDNSARGGEDNPENGKRRKGSQEDETLERLSSDDYVLGENRAVRVEFRDADGHYEWIDVRSDRLAVAGRFISDSIKSELTSADNEGGSDSKKSGAMKKVGRDAGNDSSSDFSNASICQFPGYGACGLSNLGNTCYANSALQCLSNTPLIRSYFLSGQFNLDLNKDNPLGTGGKVLLDFVELMRFMWSGKFGMKPPSKFRSTLGKARPQYSGGDQQDAQEFLNDILDILHEDGNRVIRKPYVEAPEDAWIKNVGLPRVGLESWRRFLRRNQSVMTNIAMGQVLNRVTCPVCNHTSWNFDPFNMLSTPFPTVAEVVFRVRFIRRGTVQNCPSTLDFKGAFRKEDAGKGNVSPPSVSNVMEEYAIQIPRLADIAELKTRLQNLTNVSSHRMRLYRGEEIPVDKTEETPIRTYVKVSPLPDKEGPCVQLTKQPSSVDEARGSGGPTFLVAFESTLYPRPLKEAPSSPQDGGEASGKPETKRKTDSPEKEETKKNGADAKKSGKETKNHSLLEALSVYGNREECRMYDTNPMELAKVISRSIWPSTPADFQLGLRVDAIDHRKNWFAGTVIAIGEDDDESKDTSSTQDAPKGELRVTVRFDNYSPKWDESYTIEDFKKQQVSPLYSYAVPRLRQIMEFSVHHRRTNRKNTGNSLFGQTFQLHCHNEWSSARAGAHVLAQASRFLHSATKKEVSPSKEGGEGEVQEKVYLPAKEAHAAISQVIEVLLSHDRELVQSALRVGGYETGGSGTADDEKAKKSTDSAYDAADVAARLEKRLSTLLPLLPFDLKICVADVLLGSQQGTLNEEVRFPYDVLRSIGNLMTARHVLVLHWKDNASTTAARYPLLYVQPAVALHKSAHQLLNGMRASKEQEAAAAAAAGDDGKGRPPVPKGLQLGECLNEFCKEQKLSSEDSWHCPKCKEVREGKQSMALWRLPDILIFHLKRFNCSARWREKITTRVNFPLTGLDVNDWCDKESPARQAPEEARVYDLIGVMNHLGGMTGGHYVALCKATACSPDGSEEVGHAFNGAGTGGFNLEQGIVQTGWKFGRNKEKESVSAKTRAALASARSASESAEPLWLQFDDDLVEPIPPKNVVTETAYVLFYQRRRISPSHTAKFCTLE